MSAPQTRSRPALSAKNDPKYAITMIALHGRAFAPTVLVPEGADTPDIVPLDAVCSLMRQFGGLELHSIDVVSIGSRTPVDGMYTPRYDDIVGDRPAVGERRTWLVLRLNPRACMDALAYRGSLAEATATATERIRQAAVRAGCRASTCSPTELDTATRTLLAGHTLDDYHEHWTHLQAGAEYITPYRIAGEDLTSRLLNDLWTIRSTRTVTLVRLTRSADNSISAAALVRLHTTKPIPHPPLSTLHPVAGQAFSALLATLPLGHRSLRLPLACRPIALTTSRKVQRLSDRSTLILPVGPSGFIVGMGPSGQPWLMSFLDPLKFSRVAINASIEVVQRLVLRATAAGAQAVVQTDRPEAWERICDERLRLAPRVDQQHGAPLLISDRQSVHEQPAISGEKGHGLITVNSANPSESDIVISQTSPTEMLLTTARDEDNDQVARREVLLTIMRPRNESQVLGHLQPQGIGR